MSLFLFNTFFSFYRSLNDAANSVSVLHDAPARLFISKIFRLGDPQIHDIQHPLDLLAHAFGSCVCTDPATILSAPYKTMADHTIRACIFNLLRTAKLHSIHLRRKCDDKWCNELRSLTGKRLVKRLKYVLWWTPLRCIATAYNRRMIYGQHVLMCVFKELQHRRLEQSPCIRGIVDEIKGYRKLLDATSDEEVALVETTRATEEAELERQARSVREDPHMSDEGDGISTIFSDPRYRQLLDATGDEEVALVEMTYAAEQVELERQARSVREDPQTSDEGDGISTIFSDPQDEKEENVPQPSGIRNEGIEEYIELPSSPTPSMAVSAPSERPQEISNMSPHRRNIQPGSEDQEKEYEEEHADTFPENQLGIANWIDLLYSNDLEMQTCTDRPPHVTTNEVFGSIHPSGVRFEVFQDSVRYFKRFKLRGRETTLRIRQPPPGVCVMDWLEGAFRDLLTHITSSCEGSDYAGISFTASSFVHGPMWLSFRSIRDYTFQDIWQLINKVAQSASSFNIDDSCNITTYIVKGVEGHGRKGLTHEGVAKKSILTIQNTDNLCLPRSLVAARVYAERGEIRMGTLHTKWQRIRQTKGRFQREAALELTKAAGVNIPRNGCGVHEIKRYQDYLAKDGIAVVVYEFQTFGRRVPPLFNGTQTVLNVGRTLHHTLYILYYERSHHFQPILNLPGAIGSLKFCATCNSQYRREDHRCLKKKCPRCFRTPPCVPLTLDTIKCPACNRDFFGEACLQYHRYLTTPGKKRKASSVCESLKRCQNCFRSIRPLEQKKHKCGIGFCKTCKSHQPYNHFCFMRPVTTTEAKKNIFIFYDFETQQCTPVKGAPSVSAHRPNLCVAQRICTLCCDKDSIAEPCERCGTHEFIFRKDPVGQLVELGMQNIEGFSRTILIAHNAGAFDAQFILRYLIEEKKTRHPSLIMNGTKIITMRLGNLVFLDSLHYFHMPLSALPKAFGLTSAIVKGFFPHLFNKPENQDYVGELPSIDYYSPDTMFKKDRERFFAWHSELKTANYVFDFSKEMISYCRMDVIILRQACMVFRNMFMKCGRVCPFSESTTIASACFQIFRKNFLKNDMIGIVPNGGYRWAHNQSKKAIAWLVWMEYSLDQRIIHAGRSREFKLPQNLLVDGYYEAAGKEHVLQFHGCYWHGCLRCFPINRDHKSSDGLSMNERLENTNAISHRIRSGGYILTEIWECEYNRMLEARAEMRAFVRDHPLVKAAPLNPRDAFFGGRTENMVSLYDIKDGEQIRYVDVCSLYPYICKYGKYPVGHPRVYVGDECTELTGPDNNDLSRVEGLVKCTVLAPRNLYHPVLPVRMHQRLLFGLCRSCCEIMNKETCCHEDPAERSFEGTWVADELRKAISCGYTIISISEIWQYEITQYNRNTKKGGLFVEYINTFLAIKQEASGWPESCLQDEQARERYITSFENAEGVNLNHEAIGKNPGLRSLAKLCLNSFWGKFGQRENLPQTVIVSTRKELMEMLCNRDYEITGILPVNNQVLYVCYTKVDDAVTPSSIANVVIAAYTTAQARLKLYSYLEPLDRRALYCDTDSVIYVSRKDSREYEPPKGQLLGDLVDELVSDYGEGSYIKSFVSGGPKFYSFIVQDANGSNYEICKVKGITLNFANSALINYRSIRSFIIGEKNESIVLNYNAIRRTAFHQVVTRPEKKTCIPASVKRRPEVEYGSLPYGYL